MVAIPSASVRVARELTMFGAVLGPTRAPLMYSYLLPEWVGPENRSPIVRRRRSVSWLALPPMLGPVVKQGVAPLAQGPDLAVPVPTVAGSWSRWLPSAPPWWSAPALRWPGQARGSCGLCRPARSAIPRPIGGHHPGDVQSCHATGRRPGSAPGHARTDPAMTYGSAQDEAASRAAVRALGRWR
jgi:hypothetical protein